MPLHPADELAQIRAELTRLHQREDELRRFFREEAQEQDFSGAAHEATVVAHKKRVFDPSKLPQSILANPKFYRDELRMLVTTAEKLLALPHPALLPVIDELEEDLVDALPV